MTAIFKVCGQLAKTAIIILKRAGWVVIIENVMVLP
jgi:hypothetical protein